MAETICCCNAGLSPDWLMLIRFADQEKAKSLTLLLPRVEVSLAISILLGSDHESLTAGQAWSPHSPPSPYACNAFSPPSFLNLIIHPRPCAPSKSPPP